MGIQTALQDPMRQTVQNKLFVPNGSSIVEMGNV